MICTWLVFVSVRVTCHMACISEYIYYLNGMFLKLNLKTDKQFLRLNRAQSKLSRCAASLDTRAIHKP